MDYSTSGSPVLHYLLEFAQIHVHWNDAIQSSHPLLPPSPPASVFPSIRVFFSELALHIRWPKYWSFSFSISPSNEYSGLISFRTDWLDLLAVHTQESSPTPQFKTINFLFWGSLIYLFCLLLLVLLVSGLRNHGQIQGYEDLLSCFLLEFYNVDFYI